eukprot:SAG31_NODE_55_length_29938_cov_9.154027_39_plen_184_part_00
MLPSVSGLSCPTSEPVTPLISPKTSTILTAAVDKLHGIAGQPLWSSHLNAAAAAEPMQAMLRHEIRVPEPLLTGTGPTYLEPSQTACPTCHPLPGIAMAAKGRVPTAPGWRHGRACNGTAAAATEPAGRGRAAAAAGAPYRTIPAAAMMAGDSDVAERTVGDLLNLVYRVPAGTNFSTRQIKT